MKDTALWNLDFSSSSSVQNNSLQLLLFQFQFSSFPVRSVRFSVIKNGISGFGKTHVRSNSSLVRFPSVAFQNTSSASLIDTNGPTSSFQGRLSTAAFFYASLLQTIDGVTWLSVAVRYRRRSLAQFQSCGCKALSLFKRKFEATSKTLLLAAANAFVCFKAPKSTLQ